MTLPTIDKEIIETIKEIVMNLCEGNPGALNVLMGMMQNQSFMEIMWLKENGYSGSKIWILFADDHNKDAEEFMKFIQSKM